MFESIRIEINGKIHALLYHFSRLFETAFPQNSPIFTQPLNPQTNIGPVNGSVAFRMFYGFYTT
jgi:hypothetical protein